MFFNLTAQIKRGFKLFLTVALCNPYQQAYSADWISIYKAVKSKSVYYVDQDTISEDEPFAKAWVLQNKNPDPLESIHSKPRKGSNPHKHYKSYVSMYVIDCEREATAVVRGLYFSEPMGQGEMIRSFKRDVESDTLKPIKPNSLSASVLNFVCTRLVSNSKIQT